jgi:hypothetical protein
MTKLEHHVHVLLQIVRDIALAVALVLSGIAITRSTTATLQNDPCACPPLSTPTKTVHAYAGADVYMQLDAPIAPDVGAGTLDHGSYVYPAVWAHGSIVASKLVLPDVSSDVVFFDGSVFRSMRDLLGFGSSLPVPSASGIPPPPPAPNQPSDFSGFMCSGVYPGQTCTLRKNWGAHSCAQVDASSAICYCGGGYRRDTPDYVRLRHFVCDGTPLPQCVNAFSSAIQCCVNSTCTSETVPMDCTAFSAPCPAGCGQTGQACQNPIGRWLDNYASCKVERGGICSAASREMYLGVAANATDINTVAWNLLMADDRGVIGGAAYRIAVQGIRAVGMMFLSFAEGGMAWVSDQKDAAKITFKLPPNLPYTTEQGTIAFALTHTPDGAWYCATNNATWADTIQRTHWDSCAMVPVTSPLSNVTSPFGQNPPGSTAVTPGNATTFTIVEAATGRMIQ